MKIRDIFWEKVNLPYPECLFRANDPKNGPSLICKDSFPFGGFNAILRDNPDFFEWEVVELNVDPFKNRVGLSPEEKNTPSNSVSPPK